MTRVRRRPRPVWHQTDVSVDDGRPLCVAERPTCLLLRPKGTRKFLMIPWSTVYLRAAVLRAEEQAKAKRNRRRTVARGVL